MTQGYKSICVEKLILEAMFISNFRWRGFPASYMSSGWEQRRLFCLQKLGRFIEELKVELSFEGWIVFQQIGLEFD